MDENFSVSNESATSQGLADHHFHRMVDTLQDVALFGLDRHGQIISWNLGAQRILGYKPDEILGKPFHWLFPSGDEDPVAEAAQELEEARKNSRTDDNRWHKRKDGSLMWAMGVTEKLDEKEFHPMAFVKVIRDHTEQKRMIDELAERASELEGVIQSIPDAVYIGGPDGIRLVNQKALDMLGFEDARELRRKIGTLAQRLNTRYLDGSPMPEEEQVFSRALRGERCETEVVVRNLKTGRDQILRSAAAPILRDGRIIGAVAVNTDITERLKAERVLRKAQEKYFQSGKMEAIGRLAGGLAHEFNNMMTAVLGNAHLLLSENTLVGESRESLEEIRQAAERAADLTRKLLAFGRGQMLVTRTMDLNDLIRRLEPILTQTLGKDIRLELDLDPSVPVIPIDSGKVELALVELAVNAREAMDKRGRFQICTKNPMSATGSGQIQLIVADTGKGMNEETLQKIFEPFFTTKSSASSGMSLASIYGFIRQIGGDIKVKSKPGKGTRFVFFLPTVKPGERNAG